MRKGLLVTLVALSLLGVAPAAAPGAVTLGIGDQKTDMFGDPRFQWLGLKHARLVVPWYVANSGPEADRKYVGRWLRAARGQGVQPLVGFGHGFVGWTRTYLPSVREYTAAVKAFRRRWPWVRQFIVWNEANHCSQPTCKKPQRAAAYYDALRRACRTCTIVAADILDQPNMNRWLRQFRRAAKEKPKLLGLHNYLDVNRLQARRTREFVRIAKAPVWITETGGVVRRKHFRSKAAFPENEDHAGRVTTHLLRLAERLPQIKRVYIYHWNMHRAEATWDSGLFDHFGVARPAFGVLARHVGRDPARAPALPPWAPPPSGEPQPPPETPIAEQPPPPEGEGTEPAPPADDCGLGALCPPLPLLSAG